MAPSPIPAPLPPWARALLQVEPFIQAGLQAALQYIGSMHDGSSSSPSEWRRFQCAAEVVGNLNSRDRVATTFDVVKITPGGVDNNWTAADEALAQDVVFQLCVVWASFMSSNAHWLDLREYRMIFNPIPPPDPVTGRVPLTKPIQPAGPPIFTAPISRAGLGSGGLEPAQVALTSTDRTTYPHHWGRNYWPFPDHSLIQPTTGRFNTGTLSSLASEWGSQYERLFTGNLAPVTVVTQIQKAAARGLLTVTELQVDDVPDVQRRRRLSTTSYRAVHPVG